MIRLGPDWAMVISPTRICLAIYRAYIVSAKVNSHNVDELYTGMGTSHSTHAGADNNVKHYCCLVVTWVRYHFYLWIRHNFCYFRTVSWRHSLQNKSEQCFSYKGSTYPSCVGSYRARVPLDFLNRLVSKLCETREDNRWFSLPSQEFHKRDVSLLLCAFVMPRRRRSRDTGKQS